MTSLLDLRLLVGSYTATSAGHGAGIALLERSVDAAPGAGGIAARTVSVLDDPSFLALSGDRVYAVSETAEGRVHAFRRVGHTLEHLWDAPSGGDAPCHMRVDPAGGLVVTNYGSGTVAVIPLEAAETHAASVLASDAVVRADVAGSGSTVPGDLVAVVALPDVQGPVHERQDGPHAHQSVVTPEGTVIVADLGGDALHEFRVTDAPTIELVRVHPLTPGVGPRHMAWAGGDLVVAGELDGLVHRLRRDDSGAFRQVASAPTTNGSDRPVQPSHIAVSDRGLGDEGLGDDGLGDEGLVYVAVRGQDTIAVLDASGGGLRFVTAVPCGGAWPRHFALADGMLLVANQGSDSVAVLPIGADGVPGDPVARIPVGSPACLIPLG